MGRDGGGECIMHGGGGVGCVGVMHETEKQRTQCKLIRIWQVTTRWQQSCHAGRGGRRGR